MKDNDKQRPFAPLSRVFVTKDCCNGSFLSRIPSQKLPQQLRQSCGGWRGGVMFRRSFARKGLTTTTAFLHICVHRDSSTKQRSGCTSSTSKLNRILTPRKFL